jgi:hypothetical protein
MSNALQEIFEVKKPVIGSLHFLPMLGYKRFKSKEIVLKNALADLKAFEEGGIDGIIIENNYDLPHKEKVGPETIAMMTYLGEKIKEKTNLPIGVSVLFNDYRAALAIAKVIGAKFVRVPVFVDKVKTDFGIICGNPKDVISYRKHILAEDVKIFTDIQVKHAIMLEKKPITLSAYQAIKNGSDCLIVTGKWTGDPPTIEKLKKIRKTIGKFPMLVGSGVTKENVKKILEFADGVIVSTSLKSGRKLSPNKERNVKSFKERINLTKVKNFMDKVNKIR